MKTKNKPYVGCSGLGYRPDIDGLRAVAVSLVVIFHYFPSMLPGGYIGVDIFFVISGYLITRIILDEVQSGTFTFANFYARRFRRIFPPLILMLVTVFAAGFGLLLSTELENLAKHVLYGLTYSSNLGLWLEVGYFDKKSELKPLLHLWSLAIEEQYYIVWPLMLLVLHKIRLLNGYMFGALIFISFISGIALYEYNTNLAFYFPISRFWELSLGGYIAYVHILKSDTTGHLEGRGLRKFFQYLLYTFCILLIFCSAVFLTSEIRVPGPLLAVPVFATAFLIGFPVRNSIVWSFLSSKLAIFLGKISYPLYLWHWPLLSYLFIINEGEVSLRDRLFALITSVVLSIITTYVFEVRIKMLVNTYYIYTKNFVSLFRSVILISIGVGVVAFIVITSNGLPLRFVEVERYVSQMIGPDVSMDNCKLKYGFNGICRESQADTKIAILGESHADMLVHGLLENGQTSRHGLAVYGKYGCPPLLGVNLFDGRNVVPCSEYVSTALSIISSKNESIELVILSSRGPQYISGLGYGVEREHEAEIRLVSDNNISESRQLFVNGYYRTIRQLLDAGKKVVFFIDVPELGFMPEECIDLRPIRYVVKHKRSPCSVPLVSVMERQAEYRDAVRELQQKVPSLFVFDATAPFCSKQTCRAIIDEKIMYRDDDHLGAAGSEYLAYVFSAWLTRNNLLAN